VDFRGVWLNLIIIEIKSKQGSQLSAINMKLLILIDYEMHLL